MKIGQLADKTGLNPKTIRFYESIGLIPEPRRTASGYRSYGSADVDSLLFVNRARSLGFSLEDISRLLDLWQNRERTSAEVKNLTLRHIDDIDRRIRDLNSLRNTLQTLADRCHGDSRPDCPILEDLGSAGAGKVE